MAEMMKRTVPQPVEPEIKPLVVFESLEPKALVSIIVPVYNAGDYLAKCLDSLIGQTYPNVEIVVIDDGSTDGCDLVADDYAKKDDRIKVIHKENGGVSSARNEGLRAAKGDYITFVDADDWLRRDGCEAMLKAMLSADADVCFVNITMVPQKGPKYLRSSGAPQGVCGPKAMVKEVLSHYYPCINNKCFRREVIYREDGSFVEFDPKTRILEDGLWLMETAKSWKTGVLLHTGYSFRRLWSGSAMGNQSKKFQTKIEFLQTFRRLIPEFASYGEEIEVMAREYYMTFAMNSMKEATWKTNREWMIRILQEVKQFDPDYEAYMYAEIFNTLTAMNKRISAVKSIPPAVENRKWNGPVLRVIKRLLPYQLKEMIKNVLRKLKIMG